MTCTLCGLAGYRRRKTLGKTHIASGDELLVVTTTKAREAAERRLRAVSRRGKLAHWFDDYGEPD
jgi:cell volume regulation protein A